MAKPWEKYQTAQAAGPWTKFQDKSGAVNDYADKLQPEQTMPEWLSAKDRLIAKNFAQSPQKQVEYLQQQYPDKEFSLNSNGDVLARDKGQKWQVLDPEFSPISEPMRTLKDLPADIGDVAYDIPAGIAQGAATTAAAGGAALLNPGLALPAASAASGASGAGLEYIRQKLGQQLGIPQEVDKKQVLISGGISAASPLVFGAGKPSQSTIMALSKKLGIGADEAADMLSSSNRGLIERGYDMIPSIQSAATGVDKDAINYAKSNPQVVKGLKTSGISSTADDLSGKVNQYIDNQLETKGKAVSAAMENAGEQVDTQSARMAFLNRIGELQSKPDLTNAENAELQSLVGYYKKYFGLAEPTKEFVEKGAYLPPEEMITSAEIPRKIDATRAFDLQQKLKKAAAFETNMTPETAAAKGSARNAYGALNTAFEAPTGGASQAAKDEYAKVLQLEKEIAPKFKDAQTAINTASGLDKRGRVILKEQLADLEKQGKLNIADDLDKINAYNEFYGPDKSAKAPLATVGGTLGSLVGYKAGGGYTGAAAGGLVGAAAGAKLADRDLLLRALSLQNALENVGRKVQPRFGLGPVVGPAASQSIPWALQKPEQQ